MEFVLASASPRRKELLKEIVECFEILPAKGEENCNCACPKKLVKALAKQKAEEVFSSLNSKEKIVLGADTVVALDGKILGKPTDKADAFAMLSALSGKKHEVYTGVCMLSPEGKELCRAACTKVRFLPLTDEAIEAYIATGSPMDKAGAYGIQDGGLVEGIEGSFSNVVGLPVELCKEMIKDL